MVVDDPSISELRAQRHDAVGALVDRHYGRIHRYLARLVDEPEVAEELAQETFLNAYLALPRLADDSDLSAWLFRIATNLARQQRRRRALPCGSSYTWRTISLDSALRAGGGDGHALAHAGFEDEVARQDLVRRALAQLPLDQRVCLLLYAWTGYTCAEIGEIVGKSTDAVRMLLVRARRRFRAAYDGDDFAGGVDTGDSASRGPAHTGTGGPAMPRVSAGAGSTGHVEMDQEAGACHQVQAALPFYPRGDLGRESFSTVTHHVAQCSPCRRALLDVQATYRALQRHLNLAGGGSAAAAHAAVVALARSLPLVNAAVMEPETADVPLMVPVPVRRRQQE